MSHIRHHWAVLALLTAASVLSACALLPQPTTEQRPQVAVDASSADKNPETGDPLPIEGEDLYVDTDEWVVVIFDGREQEFDLDLMGALLPTELAADQALAEAGIGWIDGNDVGANGYELYFVGSDAAAMWSVLEPVFAAAPVAWNRVELRAGLEDASPQVLIRD